MTLVRSFDHAHGWAELDTATGERRNLPIWTRLAYTAREPPLNGWYSTVGGRWLALAGHDGDLFLWLDHDRARAEDVTAWIDLDSPLAVLHLNVADRAFASIELSRRPPAIADQCDPTRDKIDVDANFVTWLVETLANTERLEGLKVTLA